MTSPTLPYNEQTRRVLEQSKEEARRFKHTYIGTEHLLLGLLHDGSAPGAATLIQHGITLNHMRAGISFIMGRVAQPRPDATPQATPDAAGEEPLFTLRTRMVLVMAGEEARRQGEPAISPQHLLVATLREGQGVAVMLLQVSGVRWQQVGESFEISVIPDDEGKPVAVPADLLAALRQRPDEQQLFEKLSAIKQQQFVDWVVRAEGKPARTQQIERILTILQQARQAHQQAQ